MNKYQEALDLLIEEHRQDRDWTNESLSATEYLQELIDKEEKYRWHDLRKNPEDLPREDGFVLAMFARDYKPSIISCLNGEFGEYVDFVHYELEGCPVENYFEFYDDDTDEVIAWKYIEEFKGE